MRSPSPLIAAGGHVRSIALAGRDRRAESPRGQWRRDRSVVRGVQFAEGRNSTRAACDASSIRSARLACCRGSMTVEALPAAHRSRRPREAEIAHA